MAKALTVKAIENLKPGTARREIPDGEVSGLYLTIFPSGKASWIFRYRFGGRTRKLTIGASPEIGLKDARDLARKSSGSLRKRLSPRSAVGVYLKLNARTSSRCSTVSLTGAHRFSRIGRSHGSRGFAISRSRAV